MRNFAFAFAAMLLLAGCAGGNILNLSSPPDSSGSIISSAFQFEEALENGRTRKILADQSISDIDLNSKIKVKIDRFALMDALGSSIISDKKTATEEQSAFSQQRHIFLGILDSIDYFISLAAKEGELYRLSHDAEGKQIEGTALSEFQIVNNRVDKIGSKIYEEVEKYVLETKSENLSIIREANGLDSNAEAVFFFLDENAGGSIFDPAFSGFINAEIAALDLQVRQEKESLLSNASSYNLNLTAQLLSSKGPGAYYHLPGYDSLKAGIPSFINRLSFNLDQKEKRELESAVNFSKSMSNTLNQINSKNADLKEIFNRETTALKDDVDKLLNQLNVKNLENVLVAKNEQVIGQLSGEPEVKKSLQAIGSRAQNIIQSVQALQDAGSVAEKDPAKFLVDFSPGFISGQKQSIEGLATSIQELPGLLKNVQENADLDPAFRSEVETVRRSLKGAEGVLLKIQGGSNFLSSMYGKVGGTINISKGDNFSAKTIQIPLDQIKDTEFHVFRQAREENDLVEFTAIVKGQNEQAIGEGKKIFRLKKFGWHANVSGNVIFAREDKKSDGEKKVNFTAAPSVSYTFKNLTRTNEFWNFFDLGAGFSTALLNFEGSGLEFGVGGVLTLFQDILQGGYGYNLQTESGYFFIGIGFSGMISAAQQGGGAQVGK